MKRFVIFSVVLFSVSYLAAQDVRNIPVLDKTQLVDLVNSSNDTTYVINFWATWCVPCVKELPYFEEFNEKNKDKKFKVILVSMDFEEHISNRVLPFVNKRELKSQVLLMGDINYNDWIDAVEPKWSGAIPATIVRKGGKSNFVEKSFSSYEDLLQFINQINS